MRKVKFADVLKQYKIYHFVDDNTEYRQVTISRHTGVSYRGTKFGRDIGRKRQFVIDLEEYPNTFIFTRQGVQDGSYGIVPQDVHNCVVTENMPMFAVQPTLNPAYLEFYLQTKHFQDQLQALNAAGSAQKSIHENTLLQLDILLPDVDVQKAIVEEIQSVKNKQEIVLTELKTQSNLITKLRSSILSDAISGRLVPQEATDESASVLLERIKIEKERLIKEGKLKRDKPLSPITADEIPYELPVGWVWCRLKEFGQIMGGGTPDMSNPRFWNEGDIPWISPKDMGSKYLSDSQMKISKLGLDNSTTKLIPQQSLLIVARSGILKRKVPIAINLCDCTMNQDMKALVPYMPEMTEYIRIMILGFENFILNNLVKYGTTVHSLKYSEFELQPFPLAPLSEQRRIVTKIEQLMVTCDALEAEVAKSRAETDRLMQTILKEAFENKKVGTE